MKTQKSVLTKMLMVALLFSFSAIAQEDEKESYGMAEIIYILPNVGMEQTFVASVKEHNAQFHSEAPYTASLDYILTSSEAGWYVWIMGPCTFTDLASDNAPGEGAHADHWQNKVAPNIKKYGRSEFWRFNDDLSYISDGEMPNSHQELWIIDLKRGDYYRFKALMEKVKEAFEKKGEGDMRVYNAQFNANDGRDIAIAWGLKSLADMDDDDEGIKPAYEEINGEGSWANLIDEWEEITEGIVSQLWQPNIAK